MSGAAGIAQMLVQRHQDYIELLPGLPVSWKELKCRGSVTVNYRMEE